MNPLKSLLYSFLLLVVLLTVVSCGCANPVEPDNNDTNSINTDPINTNATTPTNHVLVERPLYIVSSPENSITKTIFINTNILDLYLSSGYNADDFSITHLEGVDVGIIDTNALDIDLNDKAISGTIQLNQRLDFENPIDKGENSGDNDYEVALFRVISETSSNDFKLIVRITDLVAEPKKLEILIDSFHLDDINQPRGIRELYLYEDSGAIAPILGDDSNNFLASNLIEDVYVWGDVDATTDLSRLYDQNDRVDAFLTDTSVNSNSNTYHRLIIDFTQDLNIQKVAIRGRQIGGYYGFVFILRDKNDHIVYVHQASTPLSRGSGSEESATSTYDFVANYDNFIPISDFDIRLNNSDFSIIENTANVVSGNSFSVAIGYEYERGIVSIEPGVDIDKFNTNDVFFIENQLWGLSLKTIPDYENPTDANSNNVFELGRVTITNVDEGYTNFDLKVGVFDILSTVFLLSNSVNYTVSLYTSNVIDNLLDLVDGALVDFDLFGVATYNYELSGPDANYFQVSLNTIKTKDRFGFRNIYDNDGVYEFEVTYIPDDNGTNQVLEVEIRLKGQWGEMTDFVNWRDPTHFQSVVLNNSDILYLGGAAGSASVNEIWLSGDIGKNWNKIHDTPPYRLRKDFQAVVLTNDDILVLGGYYIYTGAVARGGYTNDVWLSKDGGSSWIQIITPPGLARSSFQAVVLNNNDILVMGGYAGTYLNDIWRSSDGGSNWVEINGSAPWLARSSFQAVVLTNNDILLMGGQIDDGILYTTNDIWRSSDGGTNWTLVTDLASWTVRHDFQAVVLPNNDILLMGGRSTIGISFNEKNDVWVSKNGGVTWNDITPSDHWSPRADSQSVFVPDRGTLVIGGYGNRFGISTNYFGDISTNYNGHTNDVWLREEYNRHYYRN